MHGRCPGDARRGAARLCAAAPLRRRLGVTRAAGERSHVGRSLVTGRPPSLPRRGAGQGPPAARGRSAFHRPPRRRLGGTRAAAAAELRRPRAGRRAAPGKLGAEARAPLPPRGRRSAPRPAWTASRCCRSGRPPTAPPRRARATTTGRATTAPSPPRSPASSRPRRTPTRAPRLPQVGARRGRRGGAWRGRAPREGRRAVAWAASRLRPPGSGAAFGAGAPDQSGGATPPRKRGRAETNKRDSRSVRAPHDALRLALFSAGALRCRGLRRGAAPHGPRAGASRAERAALTERSAIPGRGGSSCRAAPRGVLLRRVRTAGGRAVGRRGPQRCVTPFRRGPSRTASARAGCAAESASQLVAAPTRPVK